MRKFKVLHCKQSKLKRELKHRRDHNDNLVPYEVFREVKAGEEGWWPGAYGHEKIKEGDILELEGYRADKAANNPQFEEVFDEPETSEVVSGKPGRPKKVAKKKAN